MHNQKIEDQLQALKAYYTEKNIETLPDRIRRLELEYESEHRRQYGSGNSTKSKNEKISASKKRFVGFISNTNFEMLRRIILFNRIVYGGNKVKEISMKGNKRLGRKLYYHDITNCFLKLKQMGIKLPKNNLSKKAAEQDLIDILREHKKIPSEIAHKKHFNSYELEKIRKSNESAFARVIKYI